jgi:hypothetical protein
MSHPAIVVERTDDGAVRCVKRRHGALSLESEGYSIFGPDEEIPEKHIDAGDQGFDDAEKVGTAEDLREFFFEILPDLIRYPVWVDGKCFRKLERGLWLECKNNHGVPITKISGGIRC